MPRGSSSVPHDAPPAEERLLDATLQALARLDPSALTIQSICRQAQVTAPTLYYHYGNKDGLLAAAVERLAENWIVVLDATVPRRGDLDETLDTAERSWDAMIRSPERPMAVFGWVMLLVAEGSDRARDALVRARDRTVEMTRDALLPHVGDAETANDLAKMVIDGVLATALQYHLDADVDAMRRRLSTIMRTLRALVASAPAIT
ncbi:MAG: TetR/AcrR family transcriptional regulator [Jiangellales bacterium]